MNIEDLKLELITLQKLDTENALKENITNKSSWLNKCLDNDKDEIAESVIEVADRYNIEVLTLAKMFDEIPANDISSVLFLIPISASFFQSFE